MITCPKNRTEAFFYALSSRIPDKKDYHDPNIKDDEGKTVEYYLKMNSVPVPNQWRVLKFHRFFNTDFM